MRREFVRREPVRRESVRRESMMHKPEPNVCVPSESTEQVQENLDLGVRDKAMRVLGLGSGETTTCPSELLSTPTNQT